VEKNEPREKKQTQAPTNIRNRNEKKEMGDDDDSTAFVLDLGSYATRLGEAAEDVPLVEKRNEPSASALSDRLASALKNNTNIKPLKDVRSMKRVVALIWLSEMYWDFRVANHHLLCRLGLGGSFAAGVDTRVHDRGRSSSV